MRRVSYDRLVDKNGKQIILEVPESIKDFKKIGINGYFLGPENQRGVKQLYLRLNSGLLVELKQEEKSEDTLALESHLRAIGITEPKPPEKE